MIPSIFRCLQLQDELNKKINENWKEIRTEEDFYRAIWLECAEAVESLPWKWWKYTEPDIENVEIEIVDIYHFILSLTILKDSYKVLYENVIIDDTKLDNNYSTIIQLLENVARSSLERDYIGVVRSFSLLVNSTIGWEKLNMLYIGKNILNKLRQELGYNTGKYSKMINGVEDNKYLLDLVKRVENISLLETELRKVLEKDVQ